VNRRSSSATVALIASAVAALVIACTGTVGMGGASSATHSVNPVRGKNLLDQVKQRLIPDGPKRKRQMARYSNRHYGEYQWRLLRPRVIVQHYADAPSLDAIFNTFRLTGPDPTWDETPNVCSHFAVGRQGGLVQYVNLRVRCRHVIGLNHTAIGIEHVGDSDRDVLSSPRQMRASLRLTRALRCRFRIPVRGVIGHNESLRSPYFRERVPRFKGQTSGDFRRTSMRRYRKRLAAMAPCPRPSGAARPGRMRPPVSSTS
jgi:hypothetical protein